MMKKWLTLALTAILLVSVSAFAMAEAKITFQMDQEPQSMDPTLNDYSTGLLRASEPVPRPV